MNPTDLSERGLETLICEALTGEPCSSSPDGASADTVQGDGLGWICGKPQDYEREYCVDLKQIEAFLCETQSQVAETFTLEHGGRAEQKFLIRLREEIDKRGVVDVLRNGIKHGAHEVELFYAAPTPGNKKAEQLFAANRFSVTRQLRYSTKIPQLALDLGLFINGLPVATLELKNRLTGQTAQGAVQQYKKGRDPREKLFALGRCMVHFAMDDNEILFCTHLQGPESKFLPFNRGHEGQAGNPPNRTGLKTDYLWREVLKRESLTDILENYAQLIESKDTNTASVRRAQVWPRYHQLEVVRNLLADIRANGAGQRYLIQHSAGSGKSNSIAWLAHQLISIRINNAPAFDSILVVTDRKILDRQIQDTVGQYARIRSTVEHAESSKDLHSLLREGKKIIISTVQKFPLILEEIGDARGDRNFAIIIDEAHSSQGGKTSVAMSRVLSEMNTEESDGSFEDRINRIIESRKMPPNASYFAFTATPKSKTLEIFGRKETQPDGTVKHFPFHCYTMKQAIQEGFIMDVLTHYTPVNVYYRLAQTVPDDPEFDTGKVMKKLRLYVEEHDQTVGLKTEIMVEHFHEQALKRKKIGGRARAMVVVSSVVAAIKYFYQIDKCLTKRGISYKPIVAFSGEREYGGETVSESSLNGFPSNMIPEKIREEPYRFLICADKFQTGYDEPLLHTMYVDKRLSGVQAVQTLSRLNRISPQKRDVFILDFQNNTDEIQEAFSNYYRTTILADKTDPDRLHDLKAVLDDYQVYSQIQVDEFVQLYLDGISRNQLDPILDTCAEIYRKELDEKEQVDFKSKAKSFNRTYNFLSLVLPYSNAEWEKLSIFLNFLVPKLPSLALDDPGSEILEFVDMESYRTEKQAVQQLSLSDTDAEIEPLTPPNRGNVAEAELDPLSKIIEEFNKRFGNIPWTDTKQTIHAITEEIPARMLAVPVYKNACENADKQNARVEHKKVLDGVMNDSMSDNMQLYREFVDNDEFKRWLRESTFELTYHRRSYPKSSPPR